MATFKVVRKERALASGLYPVRIRITTAKQHAYYNTGIRVKLSEFNEAGSERLSNWIKGHRQHRTFNENLQQVIDTLQELALQYPQLSAKELKAKYAKKEAATPACNLLTFWHAWIDRKRLLKKEGTARNYEALRVVLLAYTGPNPTDATLLTPAFAADFAAWLQRSRGWQPSTCRQAFRLLNTVYTNARQEGRVPHMGNPFASLEFTVCPRKRLRPAVAAVQAMMGLQLEPGSAAYDACTCFLLQYYLHGARISEALLLEWSQVTEERVVYLPRKRSGVVKSVPMSDGLRWVLARCDRKSHLVLPYLQDRDLRKGERHLLDRIKSSTQQVRHGLQQISSLLELPFHLTSHMARHAFADEALRHVKDLRVLQQLLGHRSVVTTEHYVADLRGDQLDEASAQVYGMWVA